MLFCEFCEIFQNTFSHRTPPVAPSDRCQSNTYIITDNTKSILETLVEWIFNLVELREHQSCNAKSNYKMEIYDKGDAVTVHNERKRKAQWTIGIVNKINSSRDIKLKVLLCDIWKIEQ